MKKKHAIQLLGGTVSSAASAIGIMPQAVTQWPEDLPPRIADRVIAAVAKQNPKQWPTTWKSIKERANV
ncbi:Cro/CI family transcriptional regulator [Alcaligenes sp. SDU_A2]|uniref:Cro/CI family transcriptional regulator n=1 Tax=Alcaligenes sp. SDU_A2 TaxID=3136634 RepID=UPI00311EF2E7